MLAYAAMESEGNKGRMATAYLNHHQRLALDAAMEKTGWLHNHYVRIAVLKALVADGHLPQVDVDAEILKAERAKEKPHGNSKRAKERKAVAATEVEEEVAPVVSEAVRRREIRKRRRMK